MVLITSVTAVLSREAPGYWATRESFKDDRRRVCRYTHCTHCERTGGPLRGVWATGSVQASESRDRARGSSKVLRMKPTAQERADKRARVSEVGCGSVGNLFIALTRAGSRRPLPKRTLHSLSPGRGAKANLTCREADELCR